MSNNPLTPQEIADATGMSVEEVEALTPLVTASSDQAEAWIATAMQLVAMRQVATDALTAGLVAAHIHTLGDLPPVVKIILVQLLDMLGNAADQVLDLKRQKGGE